ncbi:MAG: ATP-binding protein [Armatimonadetes bacterium]|nr:ATP-binding protein [Armatimonadota bacterium]
MPGPERLTAFEVADFKSFKQARLTLAPVTLLVGPNASGKSNFIEAMRILSRLAGGERLPAVLAGASNGATEVRGTARDLARSGGAGFILSATFEPAAEGCDELRAEFDLSESELHVVRETLAASDSWVVPLYQIVQEASGLQHDVQVAYNNFARGGHKPRIVCTDSQLVLTQLQTPARFGHGHRKSQEVIPAATTAVADLLRSAVFLDPVPQRMRGYVHGSDDRLRPDGSNLSGVLYALCESQGRTQQVLEFVRSLPECDIGSIAFGVTHRGEVMVQMLETFGAVSVGRDAPLLSDGTLRVLAVAAAALSAPEGSVLVIEEIDNGVHPSRAEGLMKSLQQVAVERKLSIVITTHNPALVDAVPPELVPAVTCCYRDPDDGTSRLMRLADLEEYPELVAGGPLGYLMQHGRIEPFLYHPTTAATSGTHARAEGG